MFNYETNELRLGNLIYLVYDTEKYGVVIAIDIIGNVHIGNREKADDIRDIVGLEITETLLEKLGYETTIYTGEHEIILQFTGNRITVIIDDTITYRLRFFHELQNAVFVNTGRELLDPFTMNT